MKENPTSLFMGSSFLLCPVLAMAITSFLPQEYKVFGEDTESVFNPIYYIVLIIIFTAFILYVYKKGLKKLIHLIIMLAVGATIFYVLYPVILLAMGQQPDAPEVAADYIATGVSLAAGALFVLVLVKWPRWYLINAAGILMATGVTAILGFSMGILPVIVLLIGLAVYDFISVYKTKHMIELADDVVDMQLPILLVVPKKEDFSPEKRLPSVKKQIRTGEREAMFMGLGDIIIPGTLPVSAFVYLPRVSFHGIYGPLIVAMASLLCGLVAFALLMREVGKGKPHAGLPFLNTGVIAGYAVASYIVYGNFGISL